MKMKMKMKSLFKFISLTLIYFYFCDRKNDFNDEKSFDRLSTMSVDSENN